jgi:hypothetical protein
MGFHQHSTPHECRASKACQRGVQVSQASYLAIGFCDSHMSRDASSPSFACRLRPAAHRWSPKVRRRMRLLQHEQSSLFYPPVQFPVRKRCRCREDPATGPDLTITPASITATRSHTRRIHVHPWVISHLVRLSAVDLGQQLQHRGGVVCGSSRPSPW